MTHIITARSRRYRGSADAGAPRSRAVKITAAGSTVPTVLEGFPIPVPWDTVEYNYGGWTADSNGIVIPVNALVHLHALVEAGALAAGLNEVFIRFVDKYPAPGDLYSDGNENLTNAAGAGYVLTVEHSLDIVLNAGDRVTVEFACNQPASIELFDFGWTCLEAFIIREL